MADDLANCTVELLDETRVFDLRQFCAACDLQAETMIEMVVEGVAVPAGSDPKQWRFSGPMLKRVQTALRLQRDLGVNLSGAALALDLLGEIEQMRRLLHRPGYYNN